MFYRFDVNEILASFFENYFISILLVVFIGLTEPITGMNHMSTRTEIDEWLDLASPRHI